MSTFNIFFSNKRDDQKWVDTLQTSLRELLPNLPFTDSSKLIPQSEDWQKHATNAIAKSDALICIIGSNTYLSDPVAWEIEEAHRQKKPLIVARRDKASELPACCKALTITAVDLEVGALAGHIGEVLMSRALFLQHDWSTGNPKPESLWNQYNLMVQSWEALITRRQSVNTLYVSATAALLGGIGVIVSSADKTGVPAASLGSVLFAVLGGALSYNWRRTIISYGLLSRAKARVIGSLEQHMPAQLFDAEWRALEAKRYTSTTVADTQTASFFLALFTLLSSFAIASFFMHLA